MRSTLRWLPLLALPLALTFAASCGSSNDGAVCGNDKCEAGEDANNCAKDCQSSCGNNVCDPGETPQSCSADCASQVCNNNGQCETGEDQNNCPGDCKPNVICDNDGTCDAGENTANCPDDCPAMGCNNDGTCDVGETNASCPSDCPAATCDNDGICEMGESSVGCASDCPDTTCDLVLGTENLGAECGQQPQGYCGTGACVTFDQNAPATCAQACVPGKCETTCQGQERCFGIQDQNGNPIEIQPGIPLGACGVPPTGSQGAFDKCGGADGACQAGMDCLAFAQGSPGMCMPQCTTSDTCPAREGVTSQCVIATSQGGGPTNCGLICDPNNNPTCPTGMTCQAMTGGGLCVWQ